MSCINTDGCNPDGCSRVVIEHCLFHTGDDAVAVKSTNYGGNVKDTEDIVVRDLVAINNSSTAKVGTETMAGTMRNIRFERVYAVRTARLVGLDAYDHAAISHVSYTDCHAYVISGDWHEPWLINIEAPAARQAFRSIPANSTVNGVTLTRISCDGDAQCRVLTRLEDDSEVVTNVESNDIVIAGKSVSLPTQHSYPADQQPITALSPEFAVRFNMESSLK